jgi:O-antigen ligase
MLAVFASLPAKTAAQTKLRLFLSLLFGICLLPLIVGTTSRAGLVAAAMGMLSVPFLFTLPRDLQPSGKKAKGWVKFVIVHGKLVRRSVALVLTLLAAGAVLISRNPAFERLAESNQGESRALIWSATTDLLDDYLPVGSGIGSFVEVFKVGEPLELVTETYVNHVHNDYLELLLTGGVLAALLLAIAAIWFAVRALNAWWGKRAQSRERSFARMASVVIAIMAVASAVDYPLRTPSLAAIFVISVLWLCGDRIEDGRQKGFA